MIVRKYRDMLEEKSVIRTLSEIAGERAARIGKENVFDFSLGNPSVPAPPAFTEALFSLLREKSPVELHGYSPTLGIPSVKARIAESLNARFGMQYGPEHIFPVTAVPVWGHIHLDAGNGGNDAFRLLPVDHRAHTNLLAVLRGDHDQHPAHRQLENVVLPYDTVDFLLHDAVHNTSTMHRVNDFVPYLKHDPTSKQICPVPIHSLPCFIRYKFIIDRISMLCK